MNRALLLILLTGGLLRIALLFWFAPLEPRIDDERAHLQLANCLVETGEYAFEPGKPTSLRPPLYPMIVAGAFKIAGTNQFQAVRLLQCVVSLLTVVLVYNLANELYSERIATLAAAIFCFYPSFIGFNFLILSEVTYTFFLVFGLLSLIRALKHSSYRLLAIGGILLGLGALTRSIIFPMSPFVGLFLALAWRGSWPQRILAMMAFVLPFSAVLCPWAIRNIQLQRTMTIVDCMGGRNFMMGNYEHTPMYRSWDAISITGEREWIQILHQHHQDSHNLTQGKIDQLAGKAAVRFILENPGLTAQRDLIKFFDFWGLERELIAGMKRQYFGQIDPWMITTLGLIICGYYAIVLFAGAFGAGLRPPDDRRHHWLILGVIAFHCAVHTVVFAHSRYHLPIMPFVMIYASAALSGPLRLSAVRNRVGFWLAVAFCTLVIIGWIWAGMAGDLKKILAIVGVS